MFNIKKYAFVFGILTSTVIGSTFQAYAASIIFDSSTDGFSAANPTSLEGTSFLGQVGNILNAPEISGSLAEQAFNDAVGNNEIDPQAEALIFLTDSDPKSKLKLTFDHPPVVIPGMAIPGAVRIETRRVEAFKVLPEIPGWFWDNIINEIIQDPNIPVDEKKRQLAAIRAKGGKYKALVDKTGFEIVEEDVIIIIPPTIVPQQWMLELEFFTPAFSGSGTAFDFLRITDLYQGEDFVDIPDLLTKFSNAEVFDFGINNGDPNSPQNTFNITYVDVPIPEPSSTLGLLAFGLLATGSTLLRKKKQHKSVSEITSKP